MSFKLIDLTHTLHKDIPSWDGTCGFRLKNSMEYDQGCRVQEIVMHAGIGTHIDAPAHFVPGGADVAQLPLAQLHVPVIVINVADKAHQDYFITIDDIVDFEKQYATIATGSLVIGYTGWSQKWSDPVAYRSVDANGAMHFPGWSVEAAELLLARGVVGIGIDTLSPDAGNVAFPVHHAVLGAGKYIIENVANADQLPPQGASALVMPLKVAGGTESPIRLVAYCPL